MSDLATIAEPLRSRLQQFARRLQELAGDNAVAWALYGPAAPGALDQSPRAVRSVLLLGSIDLELLERLAAEGQRHRQTQLAVPLVMTPEFLRASQDTFPLELMEIQQQYRLMFGEDYFADLQFDNVHVRLQCERELKVLSLGLRQGLLAMAGDERRLASLQKDWADGVLRILRGMLWLKGQHAGLPADRIIARVEQTIEQPLDGIRQAMTTGSLGAATFKNLYADIEALGHAVNAW